MSTGRKEYIRDKRSPKPKNESVSRIMSANRAKGTGPELLLKKALREQHKLGYRLHKRVGSTKPDIVFTRFKVAIFVNGCYWHRCPHCKLPFPKNNKTFWQNKFESNVRRDKEKVLELKKLGWKVYTVWECQIRKNPLRVAKGVRLQN